MTTEHQKTTEIATFEPTPPILKLTEIAIETIQHNIQMAEMLVVNVLEKDVDYGRTPGTNQDGLWDPGAAKIMAAFNCYADHKVVHHQEDDSVISWTLQANIINRETQQIVGTGLGACSTKETKYKYRWIFDPQNYGYSPEEIKTLKFKDGKYRIPNPEYGELVNTLLQMSAKRSECDAVKSLPGVGSALRKLFTGAKPKEKEAPNWNTFWSQVSALGLSEDDVHQILGIKSMKDWLSQGKSLNQAIEVLAQKLADRAETKSEAAPVIASEAKQSPPAQPKQKRDSSSIKTLNDLFKACHEDFQLQPGAVVKELGYSSQIDVSETASEAYQKIAAVRG